MDCDWTEQVSLLIDGELAREAARGVERHLDNCAVCRFAREDFLLLRRQLNAYEVEHDALAERRALKRILVAGDGAGKIEQPATISALPRRGRFAGRFNLPRLSPAQLAALALLLIGVAVGVISFVNTRRSQPELAESAPTPAPPQNDANHHGASSPQSPPFAVSNNPAIVNQPRNPAEVARDNTQHNGERSRRKSVARGIDPARSSSGANARRDETARREMPKLPPSPAFSQSPTNVPVVETANNELEAIDSNNGSDDLWRGEFEATGESKTARHVEQAQVLLRSFRNTRLAEPGQRASSDIAYDKRQSKKLLYQNILLRREAASRGNVSVESLLDSLEPILIDIANLPDRPAPEAVRTINERMRRTNLVAMLQINQSASVARSY
ncbi:MAG: zf-HC2 domain-containing protein [Pyrinomonadaceae bacterium]